MVKMFKHNDDENAPKELSENFKFSVTIGTAIAVLISVWTMAWSLRSKIAERDTFTRNEIQEIESAKRSLADLTDVVGYHHKTDWTLREMVSWVKEARIQNPTATMRLPDPVEVSRETHIVKEQN